MPATIKASISQADADAMPALFQKVKDNGLWDDVYPHVYDAVVVAADTIAQNGLPTETVARVVKLASIGEMFLSYIHAGMEAEVSELPDK